MSYPISVVPFHGDSVITLNTDGSHYIALKPIVTALGLDLNTQYQKIKDSERYGHMPIPCQTPGGVQEMLCIPLRKLNGWLFSINPNKVRPDLKEKVIQYQEECFQVLHDYWRGETVSRQPQPQTPFDLIDLKKLTKLQSQSKGLAWDYLASLGIDKPEEVDTRIPHHHNAINLAKLAAGLRPLAKEYDQKHFFVHICEMNSVTGYQRRAILHHLVDQDLLLMGENDASRRGYKFARKVNRRIADIHFKGQRKRVYVLNWKLLDAEVLTHDE